MSDEAGGQLSQLEDNAHNDKLGRLGFVPANDVMKIAYHPLAGELAAKQKAYYEAITHLKEAVNLQDNLPYIEPPPWNYPTRQSSVAVLLKAEKPGEAEAVYRKDLTVTGSSLGNNGQGAGGRPADAAGVEQPHRRIKDLGALR